MRIAFDMDGVLADLHAAYTESALRLFPELDPAAIAPPQTGSSPPESSTETPSEVPQDEGVALSRSQTTKVWKDLCETPDFWEQLREIEAGMVAKIAAIADARRWEVLFITSRPTSAGRTVQRQSQRWLERCGFPLPSAYVVQGSRGQIASALALDVVVDDRPENCLDVVLESKARAILVWRGAPDKVPGSTKRLGIGVVPTVARCLDVLIEADQSAEQSGDFMQRLRRLLGLQSRSPQTNR